MNKIEEFVGIVYKMEFESIKQLEKEMKKIEESDNEDLQYAWLKESRDTLKGVLKLLKELKKKSRKYIHEVTGEELRETIELDDLIKFEQEIQG